MVKKIELDPFSKAPFDADFQLGRAQGAWDNLSLRLWEEAQEKSHPPQTLKLVELLNGLVPKIETISVSEMAEVIRKIWAYHNGSNPFRISNIMREKASDELINDWNSLVSEFEAHQLDECIQEFRGNTATIPLIIILSSLYEAVYFRDKCDFSAEDIFDHLKSYYLSCFKDCHFVHSWGGDQVLTIIDSEYSSSFLAGLIKENVRNITKKERYVFREAAETADLEYPVPFLPFIFVAVGPEEIQKWRFLGATDDPKKMKQQILVEGASSFALNMGWQGFEEQLHFHEIIAGTDSLKRHLIGAIRLVIATNLWPDLFNEAPQKYAIAGPYDLTTWLGQGVISDDALHTVNWSNLDSASTYPVKETPKGRIVPDIWKFHEEFLTQSDLGIYSLPEKLEYIKSLLELARKEDAGVSQIWDDIKKILSERGYPYVNLRELEVATTAYFLRLIKDGVEF